MQRSINSLSFTRRGIDTAIADPIRRDLNPAHIIGQGYDGAGNISGKASSVQARIAAQFPAAVYVHCKNQALTRLLPIVHSTKFRDVHNCLDTVQ